MFFLLPVGVDYDARRYPVVTFTFLGINVGLYLISLVFLFTGGSEAYVSYIRALGLVPADPALHSFLTSMFAHGGFFHLLGNMVYLFLFGAPLEDLLGRGRFVAFYLLGGLAAELTHMLICAGRPTGLIPLVGASGAISACLGGFVVLLSRTRINFRYLVFLIIRVWHGEFWLPAWLVISFWFLEDVWSMASGLAQDDEGSGVAFGAHVGGFLAGLTATAVIRRWGQRTPRQDSAASSAPPVGFVEPPTILLYQDGVQLGPFTPGQVREMLTLGSVNSTAHYWRPGMEEWRGIAEFTS